MKIYKTFALAALASLPSLPCVVGNNLREQVHRHLEGKAYKESCQESDECIAGLSCDEGEKKCYHSPRRENEPCTSDGSHHSRCHLELTCVMGTCQVGGNGIQQADLNSETSDPQAILDSDLCKGFATMIGDAEKDWHAYSDEALTSFVCNPIEIDLMRKTLHKIEFGVAKETDPCLKAAEEMLLAQRADFLSVFNSTESCEDAMRKQLTDHGRVLFLKIFSYINPYNWFTFTNLVSDRIESGANYKPPNCQRNDLWCCVKGWNCAAPIWCEDCCAGHYWWGLSAYCNK